MLKQFGRLIFYLIWGEPQKFVAISYFSHFVHSTEGCENVFFF